MPTELEKLRAEINEKKGAGTILPASSIPIANHIPTGCFTLDFALFGGIPDGYTSTLFGFKSCGKTTLAKKITANFQRKHGPLGKKAAWIDTETLFDANWARQLGCNTDEIELVRPVNGQEAVDIAIALIGTWEIGLVVLDSIPGCVPMKITEKSAEDITVGELARLMGNFCSRLVGEVNKQRKRGHWVTVVLTNQWRYKAGGLVFGDPRTLPGGMQINHIPTTMVEIKNKEKRGEDRFGNEMVTVTEHTFDIPKAKHGQSIRTGEYHIITDPDNALGLPVGSCNDTATICTFAKKMGLISGGGSSWKIDGVEGRTFRKLEEMQRFLIDEPAQKLSLMQMIVAMQRTTKGLPELPPDGYLFDWCTLDG